MFGEPASTESTGATADGTSGAARPGTSTVLVRRKKLAGIWKLIAGAGVVVGLILGLNELYRLVRPPDPIIHITDFRVLQEVDGVEPTNIARNPKTRVSAGDRLLFDLAVDPAGYVLLFALDCDGDVSLIYPEPGKLEKPIKIFSLPAWKIANAAGMQGIAAVAFAHEADAKQWQKRLGLSWERFGGQGVWASDAAGLVPVGELGGERSQSTSVVPLRTVYGLLVDAQNSGQCTDFRILAFPITTADVTSP